jgi:hypothetical protein
VLRAARLHVPTLRQVRTLEALLLPDGHGHVAVTAHPALAAPRWVALVERPDAGLALAALELVLVRLLLLPAVRVVLAVLLREHVCARALRVDPRPRANV